MRRALAPIVGLLLLAAIALLASGVLAAPKEKPRRVKPPTKWDKDVMRVFSRNPRSLLSGERPDFGKDLATTNTPDQPAPISVEAVAPSAVGGWSKLISSDALADEVKSYQPLVAKQLTSLSTFNGGGFREVQLHFSMVAVALAITAEYDGDARWKNQAAGARDLFAKVANNLKVASPETFNQSKLRAEDLETLIRGGTIDAKPPESSPPWNAVADFKILMKRLDLAHKERITPWTSNKAAFDPNADGVMHEAQIIAALGEIIQKEYYDYGGDATFAGYAKEMQQAAAKTVEAVKTNNYDQARTAAGLIYQSCEKCHGDYR